MDATVTDAIKAQWLEATADIPPDRWPTRQDRRDALDWAECLLDAWLEAQT